MKYSIKQDENKRVKRTSYTAHYKKSSPKNQADATAALAMHESTKNGHFS